MNITNADSLVKAHVDAGVISREVAISAQAAIRERKYYGHAMTNSDRERMLNNRYDISANRLSSAK